MKMAPESEDKLRKAAELSLEKYCGVAAMLKKNGPIHFKIVITQ
jgi:putative redox protein